MSVDVPTDFDGCSAVLTALDVHLMFHTFYFLSKLCCAFFLCRFNYFLVCSAFLCFPPVNQCLVELVNIDLTFYLLYCQISSRNSGLFYANKCTFLWQKPLKLKLKRRRSLNFCVCCPLNGRVCST